MTMDEAMIQAIRHFTDLEIGEIRNIRAFEASSFREGYRDSYDSVLFGICYQALDGEYEELEIMIRSKGLAPNIRRFKDVQ